VVIPHHLPGWKGTSQAPGRTRAAPHVMGRSVGLSPLVTLVTVSVVGLLFDAFAVILAIPAASAAATLIDVLVLGQDPPAKPPPRKLKAPPAGSGAETAA
jgi:hypothetical protein